MSIVENMKNIYGLPEEAFMIPCDPVINAQTGCKMNMIDWADQMKRELENIQNTFRKVPADGNEENLKRMQEAWSRMICARSVLDNVLGLYKTEEE